MDWIALRDKTTALPQCDRVELYRVELLYGDKNINSVPEAQRLVVNDQVTLKNLGYRELIGPEAEEVAELWRSQTFGSDYAVKCYEPGFAVRFYSEKTLLFETAICFGCRNFPVTMYGRKTYAGFDADAVAGQKMLNHLQQLLPAKVQ